MPPPQRGRWREFVLRAHSSWVGWACWPGPVTVLFLVTPSLSPRGHCVIWRAVARECSVSSWRVAGSSTSSKKDSRDVSRDDRSRVRYPSLWPMSNCPLSVHMKLWHEPKARMIPNSSFITHSELSRNPAKSRSSQINPAPENYLWRSLSIMFGGVGAAVGARTKGPGHAMGRGLSFKAGSSPITKELFFWS